MLGHPALVARDVRGDAQRRSTSCRAARCRRSPSRTTRSRASPGSGRCTSPGCTATARPAAPARAARRRCACTARRACRPCRSRANTGRPMRAMIRMLTTTYGRIGELHADLRHRRADDAHAERQHVHRPARPCEPLNSSFSLRAHLERVDPVVGRARRCPSTASRRRCAPRRARRRSGPSARSSSPATGPGSACVNVPLRPSASQSRSYSSCEPSTQWMDCGPRQVRHLLDPAQQVGIGRQRRGHVTGQRGCSHR